MNDSTQASSQSPIGLSRSLVASRNKTFKIVALMVLGVTLIVCFIASLCLGRYGVDPFDAANALFAALTGQATQDAAISSVVIGVRLPRVLLGMLVGLALAVSGASYQAVFGNPLVSSDILGVSSGASFGAALGILVSGGALLTQGLSLLFGLASVGLVILLGRIRQRTQLYMLVLAGVVVSSLFTALVSLIKYVSDPYDKLPAITTWLMGSLASASFSDVVVAAIVVIPCCALLVALRWKLNLLSLDEEEACSLGLNVGRLRLIVILLATFMTATTVSLCGVIGWIGLVIPHVARMIIGNDHRYLIPASILLGSSYMLVIDDVARTMFAAEIPLSILTAIIGAPFFAWILRKTNRGS